MSLRIIFLGISTFSEFLLRNLAEHESEHVELVAVDRDEERINAVTELVHQPIIGDARKKDLLERIDVAGADRIVVSLGDIENSLVCVLLLKNLEVQHVTAKALNEEHAEILRLLRVDDIVFPEKSMAEIAALRLLQPGTRAVMTVPTGQRLVEVAVSETLVGQDLAPASIREKYNVHLLMVIDASGTINSEVSPTYHVNAGDKLLLAGLEHDIRRFENRPA